MNSRAYSDGKYYLYASSLRITISVFFNLVNDAARNKSKGQDRLFRLGVKYWECKLMKIKL